MKEIARKYEQLEMMYYAQGVALVRAHATLQEAEHVLTFLHGCVATDLPAYSHDRLVVSKSRTRTIDNAAVLAKIREAMG